MKYYKLIKDNTIVGAVTSNNFVRYSLISHSYIRTDETNGEYISYKGQTYRSTWMRPIVQQKDYIEVMVLEITEDEYNTLIAAIETNDTVIEYEYEEQEPINNIQIDNIEVTSVEFVKNSKINELSLTCRRTIEAGFDLELRGELHHFSLDTQDQLNLISLSAMAQTQELIPYHADGEECMFYTAAEINSIVAAATSFKIYHTTYYNALKNYVNALETIEEVSAITYGTPIPEEYQSDVLKTLAVE